MMRNDARKWWRTRSVSGTPIQAARRHTALFGVAFFPVAAILRYALAGVAMSETHWLTFGGSGFCTSDASTLVDFFAAIVFCRGVVLTGSTSSSSLPAKDSDSFHQPARSFSSLILFTSLTSFFTAAFFRAIFLGGSASTLSGSLRSLDASSCTSITNSNN